jgi:DNA invertase Pin-like site-specific DNA recombinase
VRGSKLAQEQIIEMREQKASGAVTLSTLARRFGISKQHAHRIVRRKKWAHVR